MDFHTRSLQKEVRRMQTESRNQNSPYWDLGYLDMVINEHLSSSELILKNAERLSRSVGKIRIELYLSRLEDFGRCMRY